MNNFALDPSTKFLDPERILFSAGLTAGQTVVDLGAGSGFYSLAAGKLSGDQGLVYSVDILERALEHVASEGRVKGLRNLKTLRTDLEQSNSCKAIPTGTADLVILANILHQIRKPEVLFAESYRLLKTGGKLLTVEWNDQPGPIGPPVAERMGQKQLIKLATSSNFKEAGLVPADIYHYGLVFIK
jgi:ubiquinone/menaquinone biosynthesis C-methylase UbiE